MCIRKTIFALPILFTNAADANNINLYAGLDAGVASFNADVEGRLYLQTPYGEDHDYLGTPLFQTRNASLLIKPYLGVSKDMDRFSIFGEVGLPILRHKKVFHNINVLTNTPLGEDDINGTTFEKREIDTIHNLTFQQKDFLSLGFGFQFPFIESIKMTFRMDLIGSTQKVVLNSDFNDDKDGIYKKAIFSFAPGIGVDVKVQENLHLTVNYTYRITPNKLTSNLYIEPEAANDSATFKIAGNSAHLVSMGVKWVF